jgi:transposase-like protein
MPRPDFPRTFPEFAERFPNEKACWDYLVESRWPDGLQCPGGHPATLLSTRPVFQCVNGHQWSATSGTIMHDTKLPLKVWFWAAHFVTTQTPGMSAKQLARQLDLNYEPAYMMLQKLRAGMVNPAREKLRGPVQVDEAFITGGREAEGMKGVLQPVIAALEVKDGKKVGRLRLRAIPNTKNRALLRFILDHVERGALIRTDGKPGYRQIERHGYEHAAEEGDVGYPLPHIHRVFSNLKTWILGTHHGAIMHKHLQAYLNEFAFRFNRRKTPMAAFQTVLGIGTHVQGPTYEGIYHGVGWHHPNPEEGT